MKLASSILGISIVTICIGTSSLAADTANKDDIPQNGKGLAQNPNVDYERDKFFETHYVPLPSPSTIRETFQRNMTDILGEAEKESSSTPTVASPGNVQKGPSDNLALNQEYYFRHLLLKVETIYTLPFEGGYLYSPKQAIRALKKIGINGAFLKDIEVYQARS